MSDLPDVRGRLTPQRDLSDLTWLRVGGPADWLFQPADREDLAAFLRDLDPDVPVTPLGVRWSGYSGVRRRSWKSPPPRSSIQT